jgi:hypothetical protein
VHLSSLSPEQSLAIFGPLPAILMAPLLPPIRFFLCFFCHKNLYDYVCDRLASWGKTDERIWSAPTAGGNRRAKWSSAWGLLLLLSHIGGIEMIGTKVAVEVEDEEA